MLPPANEVWGKVIFSQASVILSRRGGGSASGGRGSASGGVCIRGEGSASEGVCIQGRSVSRGSLHPGVLHPGEVCIRGSLHPQGSASGGVVCIPGGLHTGEVCIQGESASGGVCIQGFCIHRGLHTGKSVQPPTPDADPCGCRTLARRLPPPLPRDSDPRPYYILRDTVNERAVRMLLECNLVQFYVKLYQQQNKFITLQILIFLFYYRTK